MAGKVIISCAVTGAIHTPSMSDYLPITPEEIARSSIEAAEAGAAIIHLHARDPQDRRAHAGPAVFMRFLPVIKQSADAVVNITTGGGLNMTLDDRLGGAAAGEAGDVQPQHGQHELQHLPRRRSGEDLEARRGRNRISIARTIISSATRSATSPASSNGWARRTARASSSNATTSAISTISPTASIRRSSSRRCSCRRSSASSAASALIRAICCS